MGAARGRLQPPFAIGAVGLRRVLPRLHGDPGGVLHSRPAGLHHPDDRDTNHAPVFHALIAVPFGWLPFAVLVLRELDESFTNVYSTAVSVQNLRPLADRRVLAIVIGVLATIGALR